MITIYKVIDFLKPLIIDKVLPVFTATLVIIIGNVFIENFKNKQRRRELEVLLNISINEQLEYINTIKSNLNISDLPPIIDSCLTQLENDEVYKESIKQVGVLSWKKAKAIVKYNNLLRRTIFEFKTSLNENYNDGYEKVILSPNSLNSLNRQMELIKEKADLTISILRKNN